MSKAQKAIFSSMLIVLALALVYISFSITSVPEIKVDELSDFDHIDINVSVKFDDSLLYSFAPDGSGIIYAYQERTSKRQTLKYAFYFLDFQTRKQWLINEIDLHDKLELEFSETSNAKPFIAWLNPEVAVLGGEKYSGLCGPENSNGISVFNLQSRELMPVTYVDVSCAETSEIYDQQIAQIYEKYSSNKQNFKVYDIPFWTQHTGEVYVLLTDNGTIYLVGDSGYSFLVDALQEITPDRFFSNDNLKIDSSIRYYTYDQRIYSNDEQYFFTFTSAESSDSKCWICLIIPFRETVSDRYMEIYSQDNRLIKKVHHDTLGMIYRPLPEFTGYASFWSNDDKIILIKDMEGGKYYRVYFIDPKKN